MAQSSLFWTTSSPTTGDGPETGYTQENWSALLRQMIHAYAANRGVLIGHENSLLVSNPATTTIRVAKGSALVHGCWYENTAQIDFVPGDGTCPALPVTAQIHRVVLRKSWAAKTVRLAFISGTDAAGPSTPALTQTPNTTFDIPLYQFQIDSLGAITNAVDQRENIGDIRVFINEVENTKQTYGFCVNQGASDNESYSAKSSDVAHAMTTNFEADTYYCVKKVVGAEGGALIEGLTETSIGAVLAARVTTVDATRSTAGVAGVILESAKDDGGGGIGTIGADKNILAVRDSATTRFILDSDGDSHQDVGTAWTNFDTFDDIALLTALSVGVSRQDDPIRREFGQFLEDNQEPLERAKLVAFNSDGHHFVNMSRLTMLLTGAVRQLSHGLQSTEQRLQVMERRLAALPEPR